MRRTWFVLATGVLVLVAWCNPLHADAVGCALSSGSFSLAIHALISSCADSLVSAQHSFTGRGYLGDWGACSLQSSSYLLLPGYAGQMARFKAGTPVGVPVEPGAGPPVTDLITVFPNPVSDGSAVKFQFSMAEPGWAELQIIDLRGRVVRSLFSGTALRGPNTVAWDGRDGKGHRVSSGVYFYRLIAEKREVSRRLLLIR